MAAVGALAGCTTGCVSLQTAGPVTPVTQGDVGYPNIQLWPSPPTATETAAQLVGGFLQAARSGAQNIPIANAYLTGPALQSWKNDRQKVIIVADGTESAPTLVGGTDGLPAETVSITGDVVGTLDDQAQYSAQASSVPYNFEVVKTKDGYRISGLPDDFGVVLQQSEFESEYAVHDIFFANTAQNGKLIPTQVYLPSADTDQVAAETLAGLVLHGVPDRLVYAASSGVPSAKLDRLEFQPNDTIQVMLDGDVCSRPHADCNLLALQLTATFASGLSAKVGTVRVVDAGDGASAEIDGDVSSAYTYGIGEGGKQEDAFVVTQDGQVESVGIGPASTGSAPRPIQIGPAKSKFGQVARQPGQDHRLNLALTSQDGTHLYLVDQVPYPDQLHPVFTGTDISSLSWDQQGNLWFTAVTGGVTQVYRYSDGTYAKVAIDGLEGNVATVAAAPDSARVAVSYQTGGGDYSIAIGTATVQPDGTWTLELQGAQTVADSWTQILDFGWYGEDSLAVLGTPATAGSLRLFQLYADGSAVYDSLTQQPVEANPVTDTQDVCWNANGQPIVATKEGKLYELSVEGLDAQLLTAGPVFSPSY
jgi:hypothetical protein